MDADNYSSTNTIDTPYVRISILPDDGRRPANATSSRHFLVRIVEVGAFQEHIVDEFTVRGSVNDLMGLLRTLRADCVDLRRVFTAGGWLLIDVVPLVLNDLAQRLQRSVTPVDCFVRMERAEVENLLKSWKSQHQELTDGR